MAAAIAGCSASYAQRSVSLEVINPSSGLTRSDELVVIKHKDIISKLGAGPGNNELLIKDARGQVQTVQLDDLDGDGRWDEAVFLYTFAPGQKMVFKIDAATGAGVSGPVRAHVRHQRKNADNTFAAAIDRDSVPAGQPNTDFTKTKLPPFLTEGPAWENDRVGFRIYFDQRNTKDIWGKTTTGMVLDSVGKDPSKIYHHLDTWGMDILAVGKSLGAGSLALCLPRAGSADTLIRLGGVNMGPVKYEKIADGPVRAMFKMIYPEWKAVPGAAPLALTETISIWGGQYFYQSEVQVKNAPRGSFIVSGIVNLFSKKIEKVNYLGCQGISTYDRQSENKDMLGMAILSPRDSYRGIGTTPNENTDVKNTYYLKMNVAAGHKAQYRYYAAWEKSDPKFSTQQSFSGYMSQQAMSYAESLKYRWQ